MLYVCVMSIDDRTGTGDGVTSEEIICRRLPDTLITQQQTVH